MFCLSVTDSGCPGPLQPTPAGALQPFPCLGETFPLHSPLHTRLTHMLFCFAVLLLGAQLLLLRAPLLPAQPQQPQLLWSQKQPQRPPPPLLRRRIQSCPHISCSLTALASWRSSEGRSGARDSTNTSGQGSSTTSGSESRTGEQGRDRLCRSSLPPLGLSARPQALL